VSARDVLATLADVAGAAAAAPGETGTAARIVGAAARVGAALLDAGHDPEAIVAALEAIAPIGPDVARIDAEVDARTVRGG
jgi:hypothetical protein